MASTYINKVVYGGETKIDLTGDTAQAANVLSGYTFHDRSGAPVTGTCPYDADTSDADAAASEILSGKIAYGNGNKITGAMPNNGAVNGSITTKAQKYTVPAGYHDGSGTVQISTTEQAKLIATNIRQGVTVLGVTGSMTGTEDVKAQTVTVTPSTTGQTVTPGTGYNYLAEVTVGPIPYTETENSYGITLSIAS